MTDRYFQNGQIKAAARRRVLTEAQQLARDIERCQESITSVMAGLKSANAKYQGQRTTKEEVEYLTILLDCAKKKLAWEKQISSLRKRSPALLQEMSEILNDQDHPPADDLKAAMLQSLQVIQGALEKLQNLTE
jgi:hypothetical protein